MEGAVGRVTLLERGRRERRKKREGAFGKVFFLGRGGREMKREGAVGKVVLLRGKREDVVI